MQELSLIEESLVHGARGVIATRDIAARTPMASLIVVSTTLTPSRHSVQLDELRHIIIAAPLCFLNHHCDPNSAIDLETLSLYALRPILGGEELSYFYPTTEWEMADPFDCQCGSASCLKRIAGAKGLPDSAFRDLPQAPHIQRLRQAALFSLA